MAKEVKADTNTLDRIKEWTNRWAGSAVKVFVVSEDTAIKFPNASKVLN